MTYQQIQDRIVSTFWSEGLKTQIRETGYVFQPRALLGIAYNLPESRAERLANLRLLADHVPEVADHAKLVIEWQEKALADFKQLGPGEIFELEIIWKKDEESDRYFCANFDAAMEIIDRYWEYFDCRQENDTTVYNIIRRKLLNPGDEPDHISHENCELGPGKEVRYVFTGMDTEYGKCDNWCFECDKDCITVTDSLFPSFLPDLCAVRYRFEPDTIRYGVLLTDGSSGYEYYIVPLDSQMFREDLEESWGWLDHEHIVFADTDQISPDQLPDALRQNYDTFVAFWKSKYPEKYGK